MNTFWFVTELMNWAILDSMVGRLIMFLVYFYCSIMHHKMTMLLNITALGAVFIEQGATDVA